ncbi:MAG: hypothetical protein A2Y75_05350 [Candidatus Solincola sediminis]|uniref:TOD1/MUCI70 glycosyltransferase-like domain-containing protein n=1 Tax=Candidatus Solincola sediminis TaxID=1797199 RepID=A0A1F2WG91_9ACTN|nr:MAG: hypothetical protein A2Y75_05350 [Candidatus Solincola sediminis]
MSKIALYSAIFGRYDVPKQVPPDLDCRAIMFVDENDKQIAEVARYHGWSVVQTTRFSHMTPMMRHKFWKLHPWMALPDYDASIWVDGSMTIIDDDFVAKCVTALGNDDWCMVPHPTRDCIYDEAVFSASLAWKYDANTVLQQADYYRSLGHPAHWGLIATGANVRRHSEAVKTWSRHWWYENITRSHQDQLSLPVLLRLAGKELRWNTNMPWFEWWHLHEHDGDRA